MTNSAKREEDPGKLNLCIKPVIFNCIKHHAGSVAWFIRNYSEDNHRRLEYDEPSLNSILRIIGKSQMDFYIGCLTPEQIANEIIAYLGSKKILDESPYLDWIGSADNLFREARLSDDSIWVLLPGKIAGHHVHIHPGRRSPLTVRVRSETLRTAIAVLCNARQSGDMRISLKMINEARNKLLGLPPVKEYHTERGLGRMIRLLSTHSISFVMAIAAIVPSATAVVI